ncbi:Hypothetical predicted protein [Podarcis lilfordi]|uniref:Uncharacterized protein n=1 Tax=Podarcis lilfordi TaxID=74358 RepID=A0AA35NVU4_9SAUR|nr:Hypothetical predicted protein [Podarcis lilfordi]
MAGETTADKAQLKKEGLMKDRAWRKLQKDLPNCYYPGGWHLLELGTLHRKESELKSRKTRVEIRSIHDLIEVQHQAALFSLMSSGVDTVKDGRE